MQARKPLSQVISSQYRPRPGSVVSACGNSVFAFKSCSIRVTRRARSAGWAPAALTPPANPREPEVPAQLHLNYCSVDPVAKELPPLPGGAVLASSVRRDFATSEVCQLSSNVKTTARLLTLLCSSPFAREPIDNKGTATGHSPWLLVSLASNITSNDRMCSCALSDRHTMAGNTLQWRAPGAAIAAQAAAALCLCLGNFLHLASI